VLKFFQQGRWAAGRQLIRALEPSTVMDLSTDFPVLIEAGRMVGPTFVSVAEGWAFYCCTAGSWQVALFEPHP
jgi:hypothetical protein